MSESLRIDRWIFETLKNDAALTAAGLAGVSQSGQIPSGAAFPRISFNFQSGRDKQGTGTKRLLTRPLYQIEVVGKSITANFVTLATRMDEILQNKSDEIFEGYVFSARREQEINRNEGGAAGTEDYFKHVGGFYRINCYKI